MPHSSPSKCAMPAARAEVYSIHRQHVAAIHNGRLSDGGLSARLDSQPVGAVRDALRHRPARIRLFAGVAARPTLPRAAGSGYAGVADLGHQLVAGAGTGAAVLRARLDPASAPEPQKLVALSWQLNAVHPRTGVHGFGGCARIRSYLKCSIHVFRVL